MLRSFLTNPPPPLHSLYLRRFVFWDLNLALVSSWFYNWWSSWVGVRGCLKAEQLGSNISHSKKLFQVSLQAFPFGCWSEVFFLHENAFPWEGIQILSIFHTKNHPGNAAENGSKEEGGFPAKAGTGKYLTEFNVSQICLAVKNYKTWDFLSKK